MSDRECRVNALRMLSIDAVEHARSGHPGMPMGMADIAEILWHDYLRHSPLHPDWVNRDRFVLSNGHGSMLLYALLHLTGYDVTIADIKQFRQLHTKTPGHPEVNVTPGVETSTGPLGQGLGNAVGMAIAEKHLAALFNRPDFTLIDYYLYVFVGDGDLMEGISHEVCSLAGVLQLGKLIVFYDNNGISIDGPVHGWFQDDTPARFRAYGWHVIDEVDGHDSTAITRAIELAKTMRTQPSLICCRTTIGKHSPLYAGTQHIHGAPLGATEIAAIRQALDWPFPPFEVPKSIYAMWNAQAQGKQLKQTWDHLFAAYELAYPTLAAEFKRRIQRQLPANWSACKEKLLQQCVAEARPLATRQASQLCLNHLAPHLPELIGGSADLSDSTGTLWQTATTLTPTQPAGCYIHYGVREFGMSAIMNGLALSHLRPFGSTFLAFSDYAKHAVRLAALMRLPVIFIYTHDSIGLGEDGPTHQPIEQLSSLRLIPGLSVWRPCDSVETAFAWSSAIETPGPTCLILSRQTLPYCPRTPAQLKAIHRGGYIVYQEHASPPMVMLLATGSEVHLALAAAQQLTQEAIATRVISIPSMNTFLAQNKEYQETVLPPQITVRIAIEAGVSHYWHALIGTAGAIIGIDCFGLSAPCQALLTHFGFDSQHIIKRVKQLLFSSPLQGKTVHDYQNSN